MSTANFSYQNRCIVVTEDDFAFNNLPRLGQNCNNSRSYDSKELEANEQFYLFTPVLIGGYYEGACIDFIAKDFEDCYYYEGKDWKSKSELLRDFADSYKMDFAKLYKACNKLNIWDSYDKAVELLERKEQTRLNELLDEIRDKHGYIEIVETGRFSNGSAVYKRIN